MECYEVNDYLGRTIALYDNIKAKICKEHNVSQTSFDVLMFLKNHPKFNTAKDICTFRGIKSGIVSVEVEKLVKQGLLTREIDEFDRRKQRLILQEQSTEITNMGTNMQNCFLDALISDLTEEEKQAYGNLIKKLTNTLSRLESEKFNYAEK